MKGINIAEMKIGRLGYIFYVRCEGKYFEDDTQTLNLKGRYDN